MDGNLRENEVKNYTAGHCLLPVPIRSAEFGAEKHASDDTK